MSKEINLGFMTGVGEGVIDDYEGFITNEEEWI